MGILKKIGKAIKRVAKGVKKVFKKATKFVGRAMASKWGKALMIAAIIFSAGAAAGAWGGFGAGGTAAGGSAANAGGFFSKFVSGAKGMLGVGQQTAASAASGTSALAKGAGAAANLAKASGSLVPTAAQAASATAVPLASPGVGGMMANAGRAAMSFLKSPGGATLAGNVISGYAQGRQQEEELAEEERRARYYDAAWRDPAQLSQLHDAASADLNTPLGFMNRARRVTQFLDERANRFPLPPASTPEQVAAFARGG